MSRTLYTGGTFDIFHPGHVNFLRRCRALAGEGGVVVVALNRDDFVERFKGHPPVFPYLDREAILLACRYVDHVIPNFGDEDSSKVIELVKPDIIAIGEDWRNRDYYSQMGFDQQWLNDRSIHLVYLPYSYASAGRPSSLIRPQL